MIRDTNHTDTDRMRMIQTLVTMVNGLGVLSPAEGIETAAEAKTCCEPGFNLAQGSCYGYPIPAAGSGKF